MALSGSPSSAPDNASSPQAVSNLPSATHPRSIRMRRTFKPYPMYSGFLSVKSVISYRNDTWTTQPSDLLYIAAKLSKYVDLPRSGLESIEVILRRSAYTTALTVCKGVHYIFSCCACWVGKEKPYLWRITQPRSLEDILAILGQADTGRIRVLEELGLKAEMVLFWSALRNQEVDHKAEDKKHSLDFHDVIDISDEGEDEWFED